MKKLISIYVSLFLVFSPAFAESKFSVNTPTEDIKSWTVTLSSGQIHSNVQFQEVRGDYLDISEMGVPRTIYIESIANISAIIKGKTKAGKGAKIGFIIGLFPGLFLGLVVGCAENNECHNPEAIPIVGGLVGGVGAAFGAVIGSFFKYVEEYDMTDLSFYEKRDKIQEIMEK